MKKTILFLGGILSVLFFISCSKEQLKPTVSTNTQVSPGQAVANGLPATPRPPCCGAGGSSIVQKGTAHMGLLDGTLVTTPTKPPGAKGASIGQKAKSDNTGLNGSLATTPTEPKPTGPSGIVKTARGSRTEINGASTISPQRPPMP